jgi:hypothetical protein
MEKLNNIENIDARGFTRFYASKEGSIEQAYKFITTKITSGSIIKAKNRFPITVGTQRI